MAAAEVIYFRSTTQPFGNSPYQHRLDSSAAPALPSLEKIERSSGLLYWRPVILPCCDLTDEGHARPEWR